MKRHLLSVEALTSNDDDRLRVELRLSEVRSLLDAIEAAGPGPSSRDLAGALARLGCRIVEMAGSMAAK